MNYTNWTKPALQQIYMLNLKLSASTIDYVVQWLQQFEGNIDILGSYLTFVKINSVQLT